MDIITGIGIIGMSRRGYGPMGIIGLRDLGEDCYGLGTSGFTNYDLLSLTSSSTSETFSIVKR
jgi:hypothetical protein